MKSVQFNVRIRQDVAEGLRAEAKERGILPSVLLRELATGHRAQTRPGVWVELGAGLHNALEAVAAARDTTAESLLKEIVGTAAREMLFELAADLPSVDFGLDDELLDLVDDGQTAGQRRAVDSAQGLPSGERRRRPRRLTLADAERAELADLPPAVPRTGEALREWRRSRGLDEAAVGRLCGVSKVAIGLWERKAALPPTILLKLGRGLCGHFDES